MTSIDLNNLDTYTYEAYANEFEAWGASGEGAKYELKMQGYIRLNQARSQRILKTVHLQPAVIAAVESIRQKMVWLVITEPWCGDSAQNLPILAMAAAAQPDLIDLKIVLRDDYPLLMNNYLTNGAKAIPKLIAFDAVQFNELFTWGPRPAPAQVLMSAWKADPAGKSWDDFEQDLHTWYARDKAQTMQSELIGLLQKINF